MTNKWVHMDSDTMPPNLALIAYYNHPSGYIFATGKEHAEIKVQYPDVTHWKVFTREPDVNED